MPEENQTQPEIPQTPADSTPTNTDTGIAPPEPSPEKVNESVPAEQPPPPETPPPVVQEAPLSPSPGEGRVPPEAGGEVATQLSQGEGGNVARLLEKAREKIQARKQKKLAKILDLLAQKGRVTNRDIQKLLRVSNATVTRYLDQLEKQGKIRQVGTRRGSYYELTQ